MQIKKDEVLERITTAAKREFLEYGYEKASLRKIVKSAKMTTGNLYNYFDSKEGLYTYLVDDTYNLFIYFINNHDTWYDNSNFSIDNLDKVRSELYKLLYDSIDKLDESFILLMECSTGTKYENARITFHNVLSDHFLEHLNSLTDNYEHVEMGEIIAEQFISGLLHILKTTKDKSKKCTLIIEQTLFVSIGILGILSKE